MKDARAISDFPPVRPAGSGKRNRIAEPAPGYRPGMFDKAMRHGFPPMFEPQTLHTFSQHAYRPAHEIREKQLAAGHASATGRVLGLAGTPVDQGMPKWQKRS